MYDQILLTTDGSAAAERATPHAVAIATQFDATLHVVSVIDTDALSRSFEGEQIDFLETSTIDEVEQLRDNVQTSIDRITTRAQTAGVDVIQAILKGTPQQAIVDYAEENEIDLVVMGSRGHGGVRRLMVGSVTERVARTATMPVLVVGVQTEAADETESNQSTAAHDNATDES